MILYIDVCVSDDSRTRRLVEALLRRLGEDIVRVNIGEMNLLRYFTDLFCLLRDQRTAFVSN